MCLSSLHLHRFTGFIQLMLTAQNHFQTRINVFDFSKRKASDFNSPISLALRIFVQQMKLVPAALCMWEFFLVRSFKYA